MRLINWFAGFLQDQGGKKGSSKRLVLYIACYFMYIIIRGDLEGKEVEDQVLFTVGGIILFCIGAVTTEFFNGKTPLKKD